jgi:restriction system protein
MAIPGFQEVMLPLLKICNDEKEHNGKEVSVILAKHFGLNEDEKNLRLNNTKQSKFGNTVSWAQSHLKAAKLLTRTNGKNFKITNNGKLILKNDLDIIDINYLRTLPAYREALKGLKETNSTEIIEEPESSTPQEMIEKGYLQIKKTLYSEIIEQVKSCSPAFFESIVIDLLLKMGYGGTLEDAGQALGRSGDEGIDGIVKEDRLGFEIIYIQAKRWENTVGRPEIQKFVGALHGRHAKKGLFITTSRFTSESLEYVKNLDVKVILVDGDKFAELMIDYGLGLAIEKTYNIYRIDTDYFQESI